MNNVYLVDALWPNTKSQNYLRSFSIIVFGIILLAISAHVKIPIPPVPVTLQTLVVLVFAMSVGRNIAFITFALYLIQGAIGLPVFANPPYSGPYYLIGSSGGYLLFVSTKKQAAATISLLANDTSQYYVNHRWLG